MKCVNCIVLLVRLVLVAAFLLAAIPKIEDPVAFAVSVESYRILTGQAVLWVALVLPVLPMGKSATAGPCSAVAMLEDLIDCACLVKAKDSGRDDMWPEQRLRLFALLVS